MSRYPIVRDLVEAELYRETRPCSDGISIRKSKDRNHANHGWLDTYHTFSFGDYHDPRHQGFRDLMVINEDRVAPGRGFGMHPHQDMEIITYVISGSLQHNDGMGNSPLLHAGDVQRISAGTGITHSEFNGSLNEPVHFLQIWVTPDRLNVNPAYAEKSFANAESGFLHLVASKSGRQGSIAINQTTDLYLSKFEGGDTLTHLIGANQYSWIQVVHGDLDVNGIELKTGDGASVSKTDALKISAMTSAEFLLFDLS
jgi:redox-sensitive bicupin YhaK (pirin superfamily)